MPRAQDAQERQSGMDGMPRAQDAQERQSGMDGMPRAQDAQERQSGMDGQKTAPAFSALSPSMAVVIHWRWSGGIDVIRVERGHTIASEQRSAALWRPVIFVKLKSHWPVKQSHRGCDR